jgi:hypothetical protein
VPNGKQKKIPRGNDKNVLVSCWELCSLWLTMAKPPAAVCSYLPSGAAMQTSQPGIQSEPSGRKTAGTWRWSLTAVKRRCKWIVEPYRHSSIHPKKASHAERRNDTLQVGSEVLTAASMNMAVFWVVPPCSLVEVYRRYLVMVIALMMEAANTSETSVNFYHTTQRNNPEGSHLHSSSSFHY